MSTNFFLENYKDLQARPDADLETIEHVMGGSAIKATGVDIIEENQLILDKKRLITTSRGLAEKRKTPEDSIINGKSLLKVLKKDDPILSKNEVIL